MGSSYDVQLTKAARLAAVPDDGCFLYSFVFVLHVLKYLGSFG
jgi:hypothetical protein